MSRFFARIRTIVLRPVQEVTMSKDPVPLPLALSEAELVAELPGLAAWPGPPVATPQAGVIVPFRRRRARP